jgi:hypothetical protein
MKQDVSTPLLTVTKPLMRPPTLGNAVQSAQDRPVNQRLAAVLAARRSPEEFDIPLGYYAKLRKPKS